MVPRPQRSETGGHIFQPPITEYQSSVPQQALADTDTATPQPTGGVRPPAGAQATTPSPTTPAGPATTPTPASPTPATGGAPAGTTWDAEGRERGRQTGGGAYATTPTGPAYDYNKQFVMQRPGEAPQEIRSEKAGGKYDSLQDFIAQARQLEGRLPGAPTHTGIDNLLYYNPSMVMQLRRYGNQPGMGGQSAENLLAAGKFDELDKLLAGGPMAGRDTPEWTDPNYAPPGMKRGATGALEPDFTDPRAGNTTDPNYYHDDPTSEGYNRLQSEAGAYQPQTVNLTATGDSVPSAADLVAMPPGPERDALAAQLAEQQAATGAATPGQGPAIGSSAAEARLGAGGQQDRLQAALEAGAAPTTTATTALVNPRTDLAPPGAAAGSPTMPPPTGEELRPPTGGTLPPAGTPGLPPEATPGGPAATTAQAGPITGDEGPENILPTGGPPDRLQTMLQSEAERQLANPSVYDDELFKRATGEAKSDLDTYYDEQDRALRAELANRGIDYSSIAGTRYAQQAADKGSAFQRVLTPLLRERATSIGGARRAAFENARGVSSDIEERGYRGRQERRGERGYRDELRRQARGESIEEYQLGEEGRRYEDDRLQGLLRFMLQYGQGEGGMQALLRAAQLYGGAGSQYGDQAQSSEDQLAQLWELIMGGAYGD